MGPDLNAHLHRVKFSEIIADNLKKAGWSLGWVSAVDSERRTIWITDAHRDDGKQSIARADETFLCRRVRIGSPRNLGNSDYAFFVAAVIEEDFIAHSHFAEIISCSEIAHAGPASLALGNEIGVIVFEGSMRSSDN